MPGRFWSRGQTKVSTWSSRFGCGVNTPTLEKHSVTETTMTTQTSKSAQVLNEMRRHHLDILGVGECRCTGSGPNYEPWLDHPVLEEKVNTLLDWEPISDWMIRARFNSKYCKLTIIQCYTPTDVANDEVKDQWYEHLSQVISQVKSLVMTCSWSMETWMLK